MYMFHKNYVLAPADKASNNVVVTWKLYYINILKEELYSTNTYEISKLSENEIIQKHSEFLAKSGISLDSSQTNVPTMYWIPKLHKRPYKQRFISNASSCSTTKLSVLLTSCLTSIKEHMIKLAQKVF